MAIRKQQRHGLCFIVDDYRTISITMELNSYEILFFSVAYSDENSI